VLHKKFANVGFVDVKVTERAAFGLGDLARYPLFTREFLDFLRDAIPPARHRELVFSITLTARKPETIADSPSR
jgi:hypothetical protein